MTIVCTHRRGKTDKVGELTNITRVEAVEKLKLLRQRFNKPEFLYKHFTTLPMARNLNYNAAVLLCMLVVFLAQPIQLSAANRTVAGIASPYDPQLSAADDVGIGRPYGHQNYTVSRCQEYNVNTAGLLGELDNVICGSMIEVVFKKNSSCTPSIERLKITIGYMINSSTMDPATVFLPEVVYDKLRGTCLDSKLLLEYRVQE